MIFIERGMEPDILKTQGKAEAEKLCAEYGQGKLAFAFDGDIYGHATVKAALKEMQRGKCCFCESKLTHITFGDVEHYRPKSGYKQTAKGKLEKPGYYWLVYEWRNLLLSCERCNRQYKKNLFPLENPATRARNHLDDIVRESPLLINPADTKPQDHIGFRAEIPYAVGGSAQGKATIAALSLDREDLNEQRRTKLNQLKISLKVIELAAAQLDNQKWQSLSEQAQRVLSQAMQPEAEYSAMVLAMGFKPIEAGL
jgi:uncharacterized protein (TIGR02646 family)